MTWRVGTKLGRTLYRDEVCVGMVDTPEIAAAIVGAMNGGHLPGCRWAWDGSPCLCLPPQPAAPARSIYDVPEDRAILAAIHRATTGHPAAPTRAQMPGDWSDADCNNLRKPLPAAPNRTEAEAGIHVPVRIDRAWRTEADTAALTHARNVLRHMLKRWHHGDGAHATYDAPAVEQAILALDTFLRGGKP